MLPATVDHRKTRQPRDRYEVPDLHSQFESLLDTVWRCERMRKLEDRIDRQIRWEAVMDLAVERPSHKPLGNFTHPNLSSHPLATPKAAAYTEGEIA